MPFGQRSNDSVEASFLRQRRNLILISLFMLFYKIGELKISDINFLGNVAKVGNDKIVPATILLFWLYFLWRYEAYCSRVSGLYSFFGSIKGGAYRHKAWQSAIKRYEKKSGLKFSRDFHVGKQEILNEASFVIDVKFPITVDDDRFSSRSEEEKRLLLSISPVHYTGVKKVGLYAIIFLRNVFKQTEFSEYVFPYLIAVLALLEFMGANIIGKFLDSLASLFNCWDLVKSILQGWFNEALAKF